MKIIGVNRPDHSTTQSLALYKVGLIFDALYVIKANPLFFTLIHSVGHFLDIITVDFPCARF